MWKPYIMHVLALIMLCSACSHAGEEVDLRAVYEALQGADKEAELEKVRAYVIIPQGGCEGCISSAEQFVIDYAKGKPELRFIFTEVNSVKSLKNRLKEAFFYENVILDPHRSFANLRGENNIYPMIVYLKQGKAERVDFQSPGNVYALDELLKEIE